MPPLITDDYCSQGFRQSEKSDGVAFYIQFPRAGNVTGTFRGANSQYSYITGSLIINGLSIFWQSCFRLVHTGNGDMCVCGHRMVNEEDPEKVWSYYSVWNLSQSKCIQEIVLETAEADFNGEYLISVQWCTFNGIVHTPCTCTFQCTIARAGIFLYFFIIFYF